MNTLLSEPHKIDGESVAVAQWRGGFEAEAIHPNCGSFFSRPPAVPGKMRMIAAKFVREQRRLVPELPRIPQATSSAND
jgi:hypothetical protein